MSVNKVTLLGRVGKQIEVKNLNNDKCVADISVATSEKFKKGNETIEQTEWHNCVAWGQNAKFAGQYISKGDLIYLEGKLKTESWEKDGVTRYATKIWIEVLQIASKKDQAGKGTTQNESRSNGSQSRPTQQQSQPTDDLPW